MIESILIFLSQLAVVKGLVLARIQPLKDGPEILSSRRCPLSYGIICRELYDPGKCHWHIGANVVRDPLDKKRWVEDQIFWFIKQVFILTSSIPTKFQWLANNALRVMLLPRTVVQLNGSDIKSASGMKTSHGRLELWCQPFPRTSCRTAWKRIMAWNWFVR